MITEFVRGFSLFAPAAQTVTANGAGVDLVAMGGDHAVVSLHLGVVSGTTPTLDVKIQDSADNSTFADFATPVAFTQKTVGASFSRLNLNIANVRRYVRAVVTITGTTPVFNMAVVMHAEDSIVPTALQP